MALKLPNNIVGQTDIARCLRELNGLDDFFINAKARQSGTAVVPPKTTLLLDELAKLNKANLLAAADRAKLAEELEKLQRSAPKLHISFAVDPPPRVVEQILNWLRQNLAANILLQVGLQPNIGAGCVLRTPNREFDMSLRQHLKTSESHLVDLIQEVASRALPAQPVTPPAPAPPPAKEPASGRR